MAIAPNAGRRWASDPEQPLGRNGGGLSGLPWLADGEIRVIILTIYRKGEGGFAFTWHWPAFFFGFWWLLYRKLYVWALVELALWLVPHLALPARFIWGAAANYLYYLQAKRKINVFRNRSAPGLPAITLAEIGGVNRWVWILAVLLALMIGAALVLGVVFLYQLFGEFLDWPEYLEV